MNIPPLESRCLLVLGWDVLYLRTVPNCSTIKARCYNLIIYFKYFICTFLQYLILWTFIKYFYCIVKKHLSLIFSVRTCRGSLGTYLRLLTNPALTTWSIVGNLFLTLKLILRRTMTYDRRVYLIMLRLIIRPRSS